MSTPMLILVILVAFLIGGAAAFALFTAQRTRRLKDRYGDEYDRTVRSLGSRQRAEADLDSRARRVERMDIRSLTSAEHERFAHEWRATQARFVDAPQAAAADAERLVQEVMRARGFPVGDFEQRAADISVDHAAVVDHYRAARDLVRDGARGAGGTENLRRALVHYRALFEELLETTVAPSAERAGRLRSSGVAR